MTGRVIQVSISAGGVPNHPIERADITLRGIVGDGWRHPAFHGIPKRAILLITAEGLDEIKARGYPVHPGTLGENLTTIGLDRRAMRPGQQFRCGSAVIRLTELRIPCGTLRVYGKEIGGALWDDRAMKGDPSSDVWGLSGFYAAVTEPGILLPGDSITLLTGKPGSAQAQPATSRSPRGLFAQRHTPGARSA